MTSTTWGMTSDRRGDWRDDSRCRDADPEMFYPVAIGTDGDLETMKAKAFCRGCQVRPQCLADALERGEEWGVWGATTPKERRAFVRNLVLAEQFPPVVELERERPSVREVAHA